MLWINSHGGTITQRERARLVAAKWDVSDYRAWAHCDSHDIAYCLNSATNVARSRLKHRQSSIAWADLEPANTQCARVTLGARVFYQIVDAKRRLKNFCVYVLPSGIVKFRSVEPRIALKRTLDETCVIGTYNSSASVDQIVEDILAARAEIQS